MTDKIKLIDVLKQPDAERRVFTNTINPPDCPCFTDFAAMKEEQVSAIARLVAKTFDEASTEFGMCATSIEYCIGAALAEIVMTQMHDSAPTIAYVAGLQNSAMHAVDRIVHVVREREARKTQ